MPICPSPQSSPQSSSQFPPDEHLEGFRRAVDAVASRSLGRILLGTICFVWMSLGAPSEADEVAEALSAGAEIEARLLANEMLRYTELRRAADAAANEYRNLEEELDRSVVDEASTPDDLRALEARVAAARDNAYGFARQTETLRRSIYTQMDRVAELRGAGDRLRAREPKSPLTGVWTLTTSADEAGYVRFSAEGTLVRGAYRLDDGTTGSLRGTFVGDTLELEQISGGRGFDRVMNGDLESGRIEGRWVATEVSGGRPESGTWTARKLSTSEARAIESLP